MVIVCIISKKTAQFNDVICSTMSDIQPFYQKYRRYG